MVTGFGNIYQSENVFEWIWDVVAKPCVQYRRSRCYLLATAEQCGKFVSAQHSAPYYHYSLSHCVPSLSFKH